MRNGFGDFSFIPVDKFPHHKNHHSICHSNCETPGSSEKSRIDLTWRTNYFFYPKREFFELRNEILLWRQGK